MRYIAVGRRFFALLIDAIVFGIASAPFVQTTHRPGYYRFELTGGRAVVPFLLWLAYFIVMEASVGATLGKLAMGIRVVKPDGSKLDWSSAFVRNIARLVDAFPYAIPYLVGAVAVWSDPGTRQRLGDRWAHSVVVDRDSVPASPGGAWAGSGSKPAPTGPAPWGGAPPPPPPGSGSPGEPPSRVPPMPPPPVPPGA
jgi:uncharacterized RDD family membrane protein YckC